MCAIFGIAGIKKASHIAYMGLQALQHRGQEGAGIFSSEDSYYFCHKNLGLVTEVFNHEQLNQLQGNNAIGHTRYATAGSKDSCNLQPLYLDGNWISLVHNGNLINYDNLKFELQTQGCQFNTSSDSEVLLHNIAQQQGCLPEKVSKAMSMVEGAYSLLVLDQEYLVAARDPLGFRPLSLGFHCDQPTFASETCAFDITGSSYARDVSPGEIIAVHLPSGKISILQSKKECVRSCIFEQIYFARPDSKIFGSNVHIIRKEIGKQLARECPADADIVIPIPDSGVPAAIGYAEQSKIPFDMGIVRSHYIARTFIQPYQELRDSNVKLKLNPVTESIKDKKLVVVDDSLVRGTTSKKIIRLLREKGAKEIHLRISSPPTISPCYYGIDTPTQEELIAANYSIEQIQEFVEADSLGYLSLEGLLKVTQKDVSYCHACFSGDYPLIVR